MKFFSKLAFAWLVPAAAAAGEAELIDFLQHEGCTIGAPVIEKAERHGFSAADIGQLAQDALDRGEAQQEGDWVVLDRSVCKIQLPRIETPYSSSDAFLASSIKSVVAETEDARPGCYLRDGWKAFQNLPGLTEDQGFLAYLEFLSAEMIAGRSGFFDNSPLRSAYGFTVVPSEFCASLPAAQDMHGNFQVFEKHFGSAVRYMFENTACQDVPAGWIGAQEQIGETNRNAWLWFEYNIIAMAAGWYEGIGANSRGVARPPLCHYPEAE